jgi:hypothetical protein
VQLHGTAGAQASALRCQLLTAVMVVLLGSLLLAAWEL